MLILTKSMFAIMIGFLGAVILGLFLVPALKRWKVGQRISVFVGESHRKKEGTPTMGGLIFIVPTIISVVILLLMNKLEMTYNLAIVIFVFLAYALLGFIDDYIKVVKKQNLGLTAKQKTVLPDLAVFVDVALF